MAVAKQRHTITLDAEVVANVIEFGNRNLITGLSGAIERLVETALLGRMVESNGGAGQFRYDKN